MTVKCVPDQEKQEIAMLYVGKQLSSDELAKAYDVSKRTINRVLVEQGVNRVRHCLPRGPRAPRDTSQDIIIPETSKPQQMELPITMIESPFWVRLLQSAKRVLARPFQ